MHAKMEVNFFYVMQFTHISVHNRAQRTKQKFKLRPNCLANAVSDLNKILAVKVGCFNYHFLWKLHFANLKTQYSLDFEQQNKFYKKQSVGGG